MFIIYRILFLAFKKIQMVRITPCQIPTTQDFPPSQWGNFPLKKHWRWEYIHTSKTSEGRNIFLRRYIISKSVMTNITTRKEKLLHSVLPPFLQGEQGEVEFFREAEDFVKVIFKLIKYHIR